MSNRSTIISIDGFEEAKRILNAYLESQKNYQKNKFELTPELLGQDQCKTWLLFCTLWI